MTARVAAWGGRPLERVPQRWRAPLAWLTATALVVSLPFWPPLSPDFRVTQLQLLAALSIIVIGLNLLTGLSGQISLGHSGFALIGGYAVGIAVTRGVLGVEVPALVGIAAAPVVAGALGFALGVPALRLSGPYLAIVTVGFAFVVPVLLKWEPVADVTGGTQGLLLSQPRAPGPLDELFSPGRWRYLLIALPALGAAAVAWNLTRSRFGRALVAIRDDELATAQLGIHVSKHKATAFAISAAYAGLGGALLSWAGVGVITPESYGLFDSLNYLIAIVVGGVASVGGSVLGAAVVTYQREIVDYLLADTWSIAIGSHHLVGIPSPFRAIEDPEPLGPAVYGVLLLVMLRFAPRGLAGLARDLAAGRRPRLPSLARRLAARLPRRSRGA